MIIQHNEKLQRLYEKWRQYWLIWYDSRTKGDYRRFRRYESAFKRHITIQALKKHLSLDDERLSRFTYRLDGQHMRVYHYRRFVGLAYIWPNIDDTDTTKVSFMLAREVYHEYWP